MLGQAVSGSGLRGQELLALAVKSYDQILEGPIIVGDLGTCVDFGYEARVEVRLQQCFHCVPMHNFIILGFSHFCLELLHEHGSRGTSLFQGIQLLNGNGDIRNRIEGFTELGSKHGPVGLVGGAVSVSTEACMAHSAA